MRHALLAAVVAALTLTAFVPAGAQEPQTLADCLKAAQEYAGKRVQELRAAGQQPDYAKLQAEAAELAKKFAARFPIEATAPKDLGALARLHLVARQPEQARQAVARLLGAPGLSEKEQADGLVTAVDVAMSSPVTEEGVRQAEVHAAALDRLGANVTAQKIQVNVRLGGYFRAIDVDDKILSYSSRAIELGRALPPSDRPAFASRLAGMYSNVAEVHAGREQAGEAIALLQRGLEELGTTPDVKRVIEPTIERYRLVGTAAPAIESPYWLNAPAGTRVEMKGKVSLVQFTAHWCGPCRKSYPSTIALQKALGPKGAQFIFSTELYGFFEQQRNLAPEQELAADQKYFVEHHGVTFPVAIDTQKARTPNAPQLNDDRYKVGGIPHIVVIDKKGAIRLILIGWDAAYEQRLAQVMERLLKETD